MFHFGFGFRDHKDCVKPSKQNSHEGDLAPNGQNTQLYMSLILKICTTREVVNFRLTIMQACQYCDMLTNILSGGCCRI